MEITEVFRLWRDDPYFDEETRRELSALDEERDAGEIRERFCSDLAFGTGGLRGQMSAGTNRMNRYTVAKATAGLAAFLQETYGGEACRTRGVVIGYDTRHNSRLFAETAANVLTGADISVCLYRHSAPTPELSFGVRAMHALGGIVVTASHNPKEYNGYKVYDEWGCQLPYEAAGRVYAFIEAIKDIRTVSLNGNAALFREADPTEDYIGAVLLQSRFSDRKAKAALRVVYTPLHGTGMYAVPQTLEKDGFTDVHPVAAQFAPDGSFPTVKSPNPEDRRALELGIAEAARIGADLVLGTDPDCDRVGLAVRSGEEYILMTGNQVGALLVDFVLSHTDLSAVKKPAIVKTVVTSDLGGNIAAAHGCTVFSTLTGFKYIGEKMTQFETARKTGNTVRDYTFLMGYEESYGYLVGDHARDKDAAVASLLICEMCAAWKAKGKALAERMEELYGTYGYYFDALDSFTLAGLDGLERIRGMMEKLRTQGAPFDGVRTVTDYIHPVPAEEGFGTLPTSDVLKYTFDDGSWIAVRPSGTEPKIKIYYSIRSATKEAAKAMYVQRKNLILQTLGLQ